MEQHTTSIMTEQLQEGLIKLRTYAKYEHLDEQLKQLISFFI